MTKSSEVYDLAREMMVRSDHETDASKRRELAENCIDRAETFLQLIEELDAADRLVSSSAGGVIDRFHRVDDPAPPLAPVDDAPTHCEKCGALAGREHRPGCAATPAPVAETLAEPGQVEPEPNQITPAPDSPPPAGQVEPETPAPADG